MLECARPSHTAARPGAKTIKKNTNSTQNKSQTHRSKQYKVTSFLSTDCELSTETCSKNVYSLGPWTLNRTVTREINGFNSRCLQIMTGEDYRVTATAPAYDLVLSVRRHRLRYLGHVLRMPADRMVRRALMALVSDSIQYPTGSLFSDCQRVALPQRGVESFNVARQSDVAIVNLRF